MAAEERRIGDLNCSSTSSPPPSPSHSGRERGDRMVKIELDAARALADFAQIAKLETRSGGEIGEGSETGSSGRRTRRKVKDRSPELQESRLKPYSLDLNQHAYPEEELHQLESNENTEEEKPELQNNPELRRARSNCSSSGLLFGRGRAKPELTEAEKEEKRLRRVLANRESARQTIRRRQALCEELTRKGAELSRENENMRHEKELALKEYLLLKDTNIQLKLRMTERGKDWDGKSTLETASTQVETPTSLSTKHPLVMHQRSPFIPCHPIVGSLNPLNKHPDGIGTGPISTFYMPPRMWFYPDIHQQPRSCSISTCASSETGGDTLHKELGSFKATNFEEEESSLGCGSRNGILGPFGTINEKNIRSTQKSPSGSCAGRHWVLGHHIDDGMVPMPNPSRAAYPSFNLKSKTELSCMIGTGSESQQGVCGLSLKKAADAVVAAKARKRRKELTKLKRLHGRESETFLEAAVDTKLESSMAGEDGRGLLNRRNAWEKNTRNDIDRDPHSFLPIPPDFLSLPEYMVVV